MSQSRYPGAKPFETHQQHIFFGRDEDTTKLHELIGIEPLVVVYAKSGMGKSSLLNAGIIPRVLAEGEYEPIPVRFKAWTEGKIETPDEIMRQTLTQKKVVKTFLDTLIEDEQSLWHDLKERQIGEKKKVLLIFDQFEELFTYPKAAIQAFKDAIAEALNAKIPQRYRTVLEQQIENDTFKLTNEQYQLLQEPIDLRVVVAIRSDRMSLLNGLKDSLQTIMKNLFELPPLSIKAAERAILAPAHKPQTSEGAFSSPPFDFEPSAIQKIVGFLSHDRTEHIESTQLQIICQSVEKKVKVAGQIIRAEELGDLNLVIENYYYDQLKQLGDEAAQLPARRFIEQGLIFEEEERRLSIYEGQIYKTYHITPDTLQRLVDAHLLRAEPSLQGGYTYELSHDTLVAPILKAKNKRLETEKQEADRLAAIEQARLQQAKEAQQQAELAQAQALAAKERRRRLLSNVLLLLSVIALAIAAWQYFAAEKAKDKAELAEKKATAVLDKIYFYKDKFGLAYDKSMEAYGFIDKELNTKIAFKYEEALPFDEQTGFAKVKHQNLYYLIDTLGQEYLLATDINQLRPEITALDLRNKQLSNIPPSVFEQKQLKILLLGGNSLVRLPEAVDKLSALTYLDLSFNQLINLPESVSKLSALQNLNLRSNQLASLPKSVSQLSALKYLDLGDNKLTSLPESVSKLSTLQYLGLSDNKLTSLPESVSQLSMLQTLDLSYNQLTSLPESVGELSALQTLYLNNNQLISLPESVGKLSALKYLDLSNNQLKSLPESVSQLSTLQILYLTSNQLTSLPESVSKLSALQNLDLTDNQLTSLPEAVSKLSALQTLNLAVNQLTSLPESVSKLSALQTLNLSGNKLTSLPESVSKLSALQYLDLNNNQLTSLPESVGKLSALQNLNLSYNQLTSLPESVSKLSALQNLDLSNNQLTSLPESLSQLSALQFLFLNNNKLIELPASPCVFKNILVFDYSKNPLKQVPDCLKKE